MTIRHYQIFREVAYTENFTKAAQRLYITQSAVSHAVRELEEAAGTKLFERLAKSVRLTPAGELLLGEILPVLAECERLEQSLPRLGQEAPVHLVSCITAAQVWLPGILRAFERRYPKIPVTVTVARAAAALDILRRGEAELALLEGDLPGAPFEAERIGSYELCAVAPPGAYPSPLALQELLESPLLLREKGSAVRELFDSALTLEGRLAYPRWTSVDSQVLIQAAKEGLGIAVLPRVLVASELAAGVLVCLEVPELMLTSALTLCAIKGRPKTGAVQRVWETLLELGKRAF